MSVKMRTDAQGWLFLFFWFIKLSNIFYLQTSMLNNQKCDLLIKKIQNMSKALNPNLNNDLIIKKKFLINLYKFFFNF